MKIYVDEQLYDTRFTPAILLPRKGEKEILSHIRPETNHIIFDIPDSISERQIDELLVAAMPPKKRHPFKYVMDLDKFIPFHNLLEEQYGYKMCGRKETNALMRLLETAITFYINQRDDKA